MRLLTLMYVVSLWWGTATTSRAAELDLFDLDVDELQQIQLNTSIATLSDLPQRSSPAAITIVTANEIRDLHARDLVDIFQRVPGLQVTQDIAATTFAARGIYAFEGRALVMIDGIALNELAFGGYPIGNDFPIHLIQRIEIIRGPGSVIYGGTAETAVINLVLDERDRDVLDVRYGRLPSTIGHQDIGVRYSERWNNWRLSGVLFSADARRSDAPYRYFNQRPAFDHNERSADIDSDTFIVRAQHELVDLRFLHQRLRNNVVRGFAISPATPPEQVESLLAEGIQNHFAPARFNTNAVDARGNFLQDSQQHWRWQLGWQDSTPYERPRRDDVNIQRTKLSTQYDYSWSVWQWLVGAEWWRDRARILRTSDDALRDPLLGLRASPDDNLHEQLSINSRAYFSNLMWTNADWHIFAGLRLDQTDLYGDQLSPRLGATWQGSQWHFKMMASEAFHAPQIANTVFSRFGYDATKPHRQAVTPETAQVYELEWGYLVNDTFFVSANVFYQHLHDVIEFRYNVAADDLFSDNGGEYGSYGFETELRWQADPWNGVINLSYAAPILFSDVNPDSYQSNPYGGDTYLALHAPKEWLGVAPWKFYWHNNFRWNDEWSWQFNVTYLSAKNAATETPFGHTGTLAAQWLLDVGCWYNQARWRVGFSIHDLGNERLTVAAPFIDSGFDNLPYKGREFSVDWQLRW